MDGGYVIAENLTYDGCISCGISDDINFEKEFHKKYPDTPIFAYDGTINALPEEHSAITFIRKNITSQNTDTTTNLSDMFEKYDNLFLKMDIETYEFRWLQSMTNEQLRKVKQIVIEFHFPFTDRRFPNLDAPLPIDEKIKVLEKVSKTHTLIHLHGNNCCGVSNFEGHTVPNVFECTYLRNDIQQPLKYNTVPIPSPLDRPNVNSSDIILDSYPFVFKKDI